MPPKLSLLAMERTQMASSSAHATAIYGALCSQIILGMWVMGKVGAEMQI